MKTIEEVINNYNEYEVILDDRFGTRFLDFLTLEQAEKIGFQIKDEYKKEWKVEKKWTRENILNQLKKDVEFGMEKANAERGISSELMYGVVRSWNKVLEEGLENWGEDDESYVPYGKPLFRATAEKYGWKLEEY